MNLENFYNKITNWLLPLGYLECFKRDNEFHFIKDSIRVVCVFEGSNSYFYLNYDILMTPYSYGFISCRYHIGDNTFNDLLSDFKTKINKLEQ
jgi:hypothetical protein